MEQGVLELGVVSVSLVLDEGGVLAGIVTHKKLADGVKTVAGHCGRDEGVTITGMC